MSLKLVGTEPVSVLDEMRPGGQLGLGLNTWGFDGPRTQASSSSIVETGDRQGALVRGGRGVRSCPLAVSKREE